MKDSLLIIQARLAFFSLNEKYYFINFILSTDKATDGLTTLVLLLMSEFASNFWSELLGYPNMFT